MNRLLRSFARRSAWVATLAAFGLAGCARQAAMSDLAIGDAIQQYRQRNSPPPVLRGAAAPDALELARGRAARVDQAERSFEAGEFTLGMIPAAAQEVPPAAPSDGASATAPDGYWREDIWHQMGHEAGQFARHDLWRGFKTSFWDLENALVLTAAMGASVAIRETGVDGTVRSRVEGHRQLGDMDETIQILGNPGTHFAATGVLWLGSTIAKDQKSHEVAQALTQALAVNGISTVLLKVSTDTRNPAGDDLSWPSGHTSSAFTAAAVLNEYYGPWVGVPSLALAGLVGYQRIDSREHEFSDVVFGAFMGYVIGSSVARDNKAEFPELFGMTVLPFADPQTGASGLALYKSCK